MLSNSICKKCNYFFPKLVLFSTKNYHYVASTYTNRKRIMKFVSTLSPKIQSNKQTSMHKTRDAKIKYRYEQMAEMAENALDPNIPQGWAPLHSFSVIVPERPWNPLEKHLTVSRAIRNCLTLYQEQSKNASAIKRRRCVETLLSVNFPDNTRRLHPLLHCNPLGLVENYWRPSKTADATVQHTHTYLYIIRRSLTRIN